MRRFPRAILLAAALALAPMLAACSDFDLDKLDVFGLNKKKPLPGDRKPLFPNGVPGVTQGVPPDLVKGYQPPPETADATAQPDQNAAEAPPQKPKAKPKAKPKPNKVAQPKPAQQPSGQSSNVSPAPGQQQQSGQGAQSPWPDPQQQQPQAAWPAPPPSGTFSR